VSESQLALLRRHGIKPVKRRGQNFLLDGNLARAIAADVGAMGDRVLELGAGAGALTRPLLDLNLQVTAVEVDRILAAVLREELGGRAALHVVEADLARLDWADTMLTAGPLPVIAGNLPYVLTSVVLFALADHREAHCGAVLMMQREVAARLAATPGSRDYGVAAVVMRSLFEVEVLRIVPPTVFWPQPEVDSAVVRLSAGTTWDEAEYRPFVATVKALFGHRRKQLGAILRRVYDLTAAEADDVTTAVGCAPTDRPEQLDLGTWRRLAGELAVRRPA
jgi:16S rRNA (adenine1518-N6/adenine1519-N6)-dimethyltransferase